MRDTPRAEDWDVLGLRSGAEPAAIRRAYQRRRNLYRSDNLATYTLLSERERAEHLSRLDDAYRRLLGTDPEHEDSAAAVAGVELPPDPVASPGAFLRHQREANGVTLEQIRDRTKILLRQLQMLESEDFDGLPAPVFVRGFVVQVARFLRLPEPEELARHYLARMTEPGSEP